MVNLSGLWGFHSYYQEKRAENCEKCSLIKIAESRLVREKRNAVCIIYSSSTPLGKNSNSIPIKLFSLVFGGPVIIWDRGGAGRPVLVWPGGPHQARGMEILSFGPRDHWRLGLLCVEPPRFLHRLFWDSLYRLFVCVSGCVWVRVCLSTFKWVCAKCWHGCTFLCPNKALRRASVN